MKKISSSAFNRFLFVPILSGIIFLLSSGTALALTITPTRLEISGDPGQVLSEQMTLINDRNVSETYYSSYANFEAQGETGSPTFVDAKDDLGTWMNATDSVTLSAGETRVIPVTVSIPKDAAPGGHFAAIFWGSQSPKIKSNAVAIGSKIGFLVLLRVNGNISEKGGIVEFNTDNHQTFFNALPVNFYYRFQNGGGDRIKPMGDITVKNLLGFTSAKFPGNLIEGNILPASTRKFEAVWPGGSGATPSVTENSGGFFSKVRYEWKNFAFGHYTADIAMTYGTKNQLTESKIGFWIFPWHLTIFLIILLAILFFIGRKLVRSYNAWVIGRAREMIKQAEQAEKKAEEDKKA